MVIYSMEEGGNKLQESALDEDNFFYLRKFFGHHFFNFNRKSDQHQVNCI